MAIFGRSFPFPQRRVNQLVGPASTVRATIVRARLPDRPRPFAHTFVGKVYPLAPASTVGARYVRARLADRGRPFPHVTIKTAGSPTTVRATVVHPVRLPDRPRPFPHVFISVPPPSTATNVTMPAATGVFVLTGIDAQFVLSRFASPTVRPVRLADRPRPFPHVTIKTLVGSATTVRPQYIRARLPDRPRPFPKVTIKTAGPPSTVRATIIRPVKLLDRPRPFPHVFISKAALIPVSATMIAGTGVFILTGIDAGLIGPPVTPLGLRWNLERAGWPKRRRKPTLLEILADVIKKEPPPNLEDSAGTYLRGGIPQGVPRLSSRRQKARAKAEAQSWAEEIVERAQQEAESYELHYAKATIDRCLREHAAVLINDAIRRRLDQEEEEAILLLLSHYH